VTVAYKFVCIYITVIIHADILVLQKYDAEKMKYMMETVMLRKRQEKMEKRLVS
jgi:hypothetical protein